MNRLKFTLSENARDFLEDALSNAVAAEKRPKRWKFAVLSIVQSIELSLKELLREVHPLFVYQNIDKPSKTITLDLAVSRLNRIINLELSEDEENALKLAKETRHEIVHFEVDSNLEELKLAFSRLLGFLSDFYDAHFETPLYYEVDEKLWAAGVAVRMYGKELFERAEKRIHDNTEAGDEVVTCPFCGWKSMLVKEDNEGHCYVCGRDEKILFCGRCGEAMVEGEEFEEHEKRYCKTCFEYVSSDYWYEQAAGK